MDMYQVVISNSFNGIGIVVAGPMMVPCYYDGVASAIAFEKWDITDPKNWKDTLTSYVVWEFKAERYSVQENITLIERNEPIDGSWLFDHGTTMLKAALGLIQNSTKLYGRPAVKYVVMLETEAEER
jgi:hypothetical protein